MDSPEFLYLMLTTLIVFAHAYPPPYLAIAPPLVYLPRPELPPPFLLPSPGVPLPMARRPSGDLPGPPRSHRPLGLLLRHTNGIPGSRLDVSELVDITRLVPDSLGPTVAAVLLTPVSSTIFNGLSELISDTVVQNDQYLFQRGRSQVQRAVSPRFKL